MKKIAIFALLFVVGVVLSHFHFFAPIHELGHVIVGGLQGRAGRITGWRWSYVEGPYTAPVIFAGYSAEIIFFCWWTRKRWAWWPMLFGAANESFWAAFKSMDVRVLLPEAMPRLDEQFIWLLLYSAIGALVLILTWKAVLIAGLKNRTRGPDGPKGVDVNGRKKLHFAHDNIHSSQARRPNVCTVQGRMQPARNIHGRLSKTLHGQGRGPNGPRLKAGGTSRLRRPGTTVFTRSAGGAG